MTDKLYLITEADRDDILHALSVPEHADEGENATAIALLQSLPMVDSKPVGKIVASPANTYEEVAEIGIKMTTMEQPQSRVEKKGSIR